MPTPSERRALLFVAAVAALGLGVRGLRALRPGGPPSTAREALVAQIAAVDSAVTSGGRARGKSARRAASAQPAAERARSSQGSLGAAPPDAQSVDVDRASEAELDALPGIGPTLARRIVEDRHTFGPFGSLTALQEVRGIGPALAAKIGSRVTFSGPPRAPRAKARGPSGLHP